MLPFARNNSATSLIIVLFASLFFHFHTTYAQPSAIEKIDRYIQAKLAKSSIPGLAIAVIHKDTLLFTKGYGTTSTNTPVTADTPFAIASLSKAFTALAIMQLVEAGQISLDTPIKKYIPSFTPADPQVASITVRQLLHQTSGLADTGFPELAFSEQPNTLDEAINQQKKAQLVSRPGEQFHYHNPNYRLLAKIVEAVSKEPFASYMQKHIFKPLQMTNTSDVSTTSSLFTGPQRVDEGHIFFLGKPIAVREPSWFIDGAAGIRSSVNDMARWLIYQQNSERSGSTQLVSHQSMALMHNAPSGTTLHYGMGWIVGPKATLYHSGILWTYSAEQLLLTQEGYGVILLFNSGVNPFVDYNSFIQGVADILAGRQPESPTLPGWFLPACLGIFLLLLNALVIQRFFRVRQWQQAYYQRPGWRSWLFLFIRLLPFFAFLLIPHLFTTLSGRVLSWDRIFLMMPDGVLGLGLFAILNLAVVIYRLVAYRTMLSKS
jgi:CubicO group peptidase (beta-lactamase class C family)